MTSRLRRRQRPVKLLPWTGHTPIWGRKGENQLGRLFSGHVSRGFTFAVGDRYENYSGRGPSVVIQNANGEKRVLEMSKAVKEARDRETTIEQDLKNAQHDGGAPFSTQCDTWSDVGSMAGSERGVQAVCRPSS
jgi:hypothetical protein